MSTIYLPGSAAMEYDEQAARSMAAARAFLAELKLIDSRLELIWARPNAESLDGGFWYIVRRNEHAPDTYWQVNDGEGVYADPEWRHLERLKAADASAHPRIYEDYRRRCDADRAAGEKSRQERHAEFRERLMERLAHVFDTQIAVSKDITPAEEPTDGGSDPECAS